MDRDANDQDSCTTKMVRFNLCLQSRHLNSLEITGRTVLVGGIPRDATMSDLLEIASSAGRVLEIRMLMSNDSVTGAYVEFATSAEAIAFIESGNRSTRDPDWQLEMTPAHDSPVTILRNYGDMTVESVRSMILSAMPEAASAIVALEVLKRNTRDEVMKITFNNQRTGLKFIRYFNNRPTHVRGQVFSAEWYGSPMIIIPDGNGITDKDQIRRSFAREHQEDIHSVILCRQSIYVIFNSLDIFRAVLERQRGLLAVADSNIVLNIRSL